MLSEREARFLASRRVGHLATADGRAMPHLVPVCFVVSGGGALHHDRSEAQGRPPGSQAAAEHR